MPADWPSETSCCVALARAAESARKVATSDPPLELKSVAQRWTLTPCECAAWTSAAPGSECELEIAPLVEMPAENAITSLTRSQRKAARSIASQYGKYPYTRRVTLGADGALRTRAGAACTQAASGSRACSSACAACGPSAARSASRSIEGIYESRSARRHPAAGVKIPS